MSTMTIGDLIRAHRTARQWNLHDLSLRTGLSRKLISNYENGHITNIPSNSIIALAKAFGVEAGELYPRHGTPPPEPVLVGVAEE